MHNKVQQCVYCGEKIFVDFPCKKKKFCSNDHYNIWRKEFLTKKPNRVCSYCGVSFYKKPSRCFKRVFCSREHQILFYREYNHFYSGENNPRYIRVEKECEICGNKFLVLPCQEKTRRFCGQNCTKIFNKKRIVKYGNENPAWKGGISGENLKIRQSLEYKLWRKSVLERDKDTCVWCGANRDDGIILNVDHIKPFALFPELRFAIDNGRTLCEECHKKTDTYGNKKMYE